MSGMDSEEVNLNRESGKSSDGFVDRSKVRILLCDNDSKSSEEVFTLLHRCSYQGMTMTFFFFIFLLNSFSTCTRHDR